MNPRAWAAGSCRASLGLIKVELQPGTAGGILQSPHLSLLDTRRPLIWSDNTVYSACFLNFTSKTPSVGMMSARPTQSTGQCPR